MQYFILIVTALIGLFSLAYTSTDRLGKKAKFILMFLLVICSSYSIYETHRDEAFLEPWQATRLVYDKILEIKSRFDTLAESNDTLAMRQFLTDARDIAIFAEKNKAPQSVRMKVDLFILTLNLLTISEMYPKYSMADLTNELMQNRSPSHDGIKMTGGLALLQQGYFRVEDFGPPYYVLRGFDNQGNPIVNENHLNKNFFKVRARDILRDLILQSQ